MISIEKERVRPGLKLNPDSLVVYHLHQKPIWFQTVQMERKNFD